MNSMKILRMKHKCIMKKCDVFDGKMLAESSREQRICCMLAWMDGTTQTIMPNGRARLTKRN